MSRDYQINGETMVKIRFGSHRSGGRDGSLTYEVGTTHGVEWITAGELGLASEPITISPRFRLRDLRVDDYGPDIPPDVMSQLSDVQLRMTLVHYDPFILNLCQA